MSISCGNGYGMYEKRLPEQSISLLGAPSFSFKIGVEYGIIAGVLLYVAGKKAGIDMGDDNHETKNEESLDSSTCRMDSNGGSLYNIMEAFESQLKMAPSHLSLTGLLVQNVESNNGEIDKDEHVETDKSLMV